MIKKKAKSKTGKTNNSGARKVKQELNPAEVRKEIAQMPATEATSRAQAVIDEGIKGQLATVKCWFEDPVGQ